MFFNIPRKQEKEEKRGGGQTPRGRRDMKKVKKL
jgi:hypothetical protein